MSISPLTGLSSVGSVQPERPAAAVVAPGPNAALAPAIPTGTQPPLSPAMLALLVGQQLTLYGSSK